jgi:CRP-like cAMP-binding protein
MPGEILFSKGDKDKKLFYIVKGNIELFMDTPHEKACQVVSTL